MKLITSTRFPNCGVGKRLTSSRERADSLKVPMGIRRTPGL